MSSAVSVSAIEEHHVSVHPAISAHHQEPDKEGSPSDDTFTLPDIAADNSSATTSDRSISASTIEKRGALLKRRKTG